MAYRVYDIAVRKEDEVKADAIIDYFMSNHDLDDYYVEEHHDSNGETKVIFRVIPYISDDLEVIRNELKLNGIKLL